MRNRNVGFLVAGISVLIFLMVGLFNFALKDIVDETCSHGPTCTMYDTIAIQTGISLLIAGVVLIIGLFLIFAKEYEKIVVKKIKEKMKKLDLTGLSAQEREAVKIVQESGGIFQADLMEKLEIGKVGLTRLLDKLEAKQIVERKRRGMNNFVVLKKT
jgi:uncharacterized membrane protein